MIKFIDQARFKNKRVLLRVDFNVSLSTDGFKIADDARIQQALPTINYLLNNGNKLILVSHLGRPKKRDPRYSLALVAKRLGKLISGYKVTLISDFQTSADRKIIAQQSDKEVLLLENIRFYPEEKKGSLDFAKELCSLADVYVNDAFGVSHRASSSIIFPPEILPSYGGLLLKREITMIDRLIKSPAKPVVAIVGGAKVSTKIHILDRLCQIADYLLVGGGLANTLLIAQGYELGKSAYGYEEIEVARRLLYQSKRKRAKIILPVDMIVGLPDVDDFPGETRALSDIPLNRQVLDIGPSTQALFAGYISKARTIIWNGPMGYFQNPAYRIGTDFVYYTIANNPQANSLVGGGDTLAAISNKDYLGKITHLSSGGGAMLEYIEKGTLPGIEALK